MKQAIRLALGLLLLIPSLSFSSIKTQESIKASRKVNNIYYAFAYDAVPQGNNVYAVTIYFLKVDATLFTYTYVNAPQNIVINGNFPNNITSFSFPAGAGSLNAGNFTLPSPPTQAFTVTTNPSSVLGLPISTTLADINIP